MADSLRGTLSGLLLQGTDEQRRRIGDPAQRPSPSNHSREARDHDSLLRDELLKPIGIEPRRTGSLFRIGPELGPRPFECWQETGKRVPEWPSAVTGVRGHDHKLPIVVGAQRRAS